MNEEEKIPEPFYHESENFSSVYFGKVPAGIMRQTGGQPDHMLINSLVVQLTDPRGKENRLNVLSILRENNAQELLLGIARMNEHARNRAGILAACWESGLDFSAFLKDIVRLAIDGDYTVSLECLTIISENMNNDIPVAVLEKAATDLHAAMSGNEERSGVLRMILESIRDKASGSAKIS